MRFPVEKNLFRSQFENVRFINLKAYSFHFSLCAFLFVVTAFFGFYVAIAYPDFIRGFLERLNGNLSDKGISKHADSFSVMLALFKNNIISCFMYMLVGLIPFMFISYAYICLNGCLIGFILYGQWIKSISIGKLIVLGLLPHGMTELTATFLAASIGAYFCSNITKKIMKKDTAIHLKHVLKRGVTAFAIIVLPLLIVSACIEAFITKYLIVHFLP